MKTETLTVVETETAVETEPGAHLVSLRATLAAFSAEVDRAIFEELEAFKAETDEAAGARALAEAFTITDEAAEQRAGAALLVLHSKGQALEAMRTAITKPTLGFKRAVDDLFRAPKDHYEAAKQTISRKLGAFRAEREAAKRAALAKAAAEVAERAAREQTADVVETREASDKADADARALIGAATAEAPRLAGTRTITTYEVTITDPNAIPREYCKPDEGLIAAAAKAAAAGGGKLVVPGATITKVDRVVSTGRNE